jgi:NDP-4-keto-2,6-dideoxyhexose 3-C-methyltransferase
MHVELKDIVTQAVTLAGLTPSDVVLDIGANDGTLLSYLASTGAKRIAYEPAENLKPLLRQHADIVCPSYFPGISPLFDLRPRLTGQIKLIFSIACFYDVDKPVEFVRAISDLLAPDGIWVVQFQDLSQMLEANAFDDICHEHAFYPSLAFVERLLRPFGLSVFDAELRAINGGSLRLLIGRNRQATSRVTDLRQREAGCESPGLLHAFAKRVLDTRQRIQNVVRIARADGQTIDLYGASTKGNTLLQYCGLGPNIIRQAWERSESKWGRKTITGIPIVSEEVGRANPPDILFVGIWQFRDAILNREAAFLEQGGSLLFPLPTVEVVSNNPVSRYA